MSSTAGAVAPCTMQKAGGQIADTATFLSKPRVGRLGWSDGSIKDHNGLIVCYGMVDLIHNTNLSLNGHAKDSPGL